MRSCSLRAKTLFVCTAVDAAAAAAAGALSAAALSRQPSVKLTAAQASRFWHLGLEESRALLDSLVADGALARTSDGFYIFPSV